MKIFAFTIALMLTLAAAAAAQQERCLTPDEAKKVIESMKPLADIAENKKLRRELLDLRAAREKLDAKIAADPEKNQALVPESNKMGLAAIARACRMLKEFGWIDRQMVREDGFDAFIFLLSYNKDIRAQQELLPVLVEAAKKGYIGNPLLASFVDSIRVGARLPQIFGTQASIRNNVVYLYPLLNEEKVDEWRAQYNLPPLAAQMRGLESRYLMPVLKSQRISGAPAIKRRPGEKDADAQALGIGGEDDGEALKVETRLVNLNARVLTADFKAPGGPGLTKDDFAIYENGVEQEIAFFSNTEQPFDLVLLLDFSMSTADKQELIKKAAQRFVDVVRPGDRVAVVAFASEIKVVAGLTSDKAALKSQIGEIFMSGGSPIWDSLRTVYETIFREKTPGRRSAVVLMSDGEDGSRKTTFADAMELVRRGETTVFPVYVGRQRGANEYSERYIRKLQQSLAMLAEESGGQLYRADEFKDLSGVYEQIVNELGQVYSLGYEPKNETRDGGWRPLAVKIKNRPDLVVRTRRGYYAN